MILHKAKRSLVAMFWGWLACNLSIVIIAWPHPHQGVLATLSIFLFPTAVVIAVAWLLIFWPVDLAVPETSALRQPGWAIVFGGVAGLMPLVLIQLVAGWFLPRPVSAAELFLGIFGHEARLYAIGSAVTGLTAALTLVLRHPRRKSPIPVPS